MLVEHITVSYRVGSSYCLCLGLWSFLLKEIQMLFNVAFDTCFSSQWGVLFFSFWPRLDDAIGNIRRGNIIIEKLANDENCHCG
jgi:hypothetical protein